MLNRLMIAEMRCDASEAFITPGLIEKKGGKPYLIMWKLALVADKSS